jgi:hypothetical protein
VDGDFVWRHLCCHVVDDVREVDEGALDDLAFRTSEQEQSVDYPALSLSVTVFIRRTPACYTAVIDREFNVRDSRF